MLYAEYIAEQATQRLCTHLNALEATLKTKDGKNFLNLLKIIARDANTTADILEYYTGTCFNADKNSADCVEISAESCKLKD